MASAIIPTCDPSRQSCLYTESYFTADTPESDSSSDAICIDPRDKALETIKHTFEELTETVANSPFTRSTISYFRDVASAASAFDAKPTESRAITNWADASIEDIQSYAFAHHQMTLKSEMDKIDRQFAKETDTLTRVTEPGTAYPLATHSQYLPKAVLEQIAPIARMNPNMINEVAFTWAWDGDQPQIYLFRPTAPNGAESGVVFNDETGEVFIFQSEGDRNLYNLPGNSIGNGDPLDILLGQGSRIAGNTISFLEGDDPTKIVFTDQNDSKKSGNPLLGEGSLAAGGMFLLGSLRPGGVGGGGPGGIKPKLPVQGMLIQGGIGTGIFLGIHYGVLALGVPEEIAHYVDVPVMMGAFNLVDQGSAMLANRGILSNRVFPGGINWGSVAHATPFVIWGSVGSSYLMDSLGFEHGTAGNLIGTIGLTTTGYVGISQTTGLLSQAAAPTAEFAAAHPHVIEVAKHFPKTTAAFSNLGAAYATTRGIGLVPATVNIGSKTLTLGTVGAGGSTGVYIAGGGFAGGGGVLAGGLQAVGAAGVVALGSWVGGGIVDIWAWASGRSKDPDYQLIDFTWNYINTEATCGLVNSIFGPLMK
ncbi:MAG: hypothetical protein HN337_09680, partial [Deltaproteobacteria bacterium]|nr:hypothetical protein [Deltaproteobacteria bacterium]